MDAAKSYRPVSLTSAIAKVAERLVTRRLMHVLESMGRGDFYILCPDNDVTREMDERRIAWGAGDLIENRPALSRWHPDYEAAYEAHMAKSSN